MSPFWILLELRMMEVAVTTGAIRCANLQSHRHHQQTNTQLFTGRRTFLSPNQQCQSTEEKNSNWSCLLISASKVHQRLKPTSARRSGSFSDRYALCTLHVAQQCLHENCPKMIKKERWPPNSRSEYLGTSCLGSDTRSYFATFIRGPKQCLHYQWSWRRNAPYWVLY